MQFTSNDSQKITTGYRHKNKANRSGFAILSRFKKKLWTKQACSQRAINHNKTLSNCGDSLEQATLFDSIFHNESNKI
jgi:hypothetical protein